MPKVQTVLWSYYDAMREDQAYARSDIFEHPEEMTKKDWLLTLPGSAVVRTAARVAQALMDGRGASLIEIEPKSIVRAIEWLLEWCNNTPTSKQISITRIQQGAHAGTYIDISPLELAKRIWLPIEIDGYQSNGYDEYLSRETLSLLFTALSQVRGWQVITRNQQGWMRSDIRFARNH